MSALDAFQRGDAQEGEKQSGGIRMYFEFARQTAAERERDTSKTTKFEAFASPADNRSPLIVVFSTLIPLVVEPKMQGRLHVFEVWQVRPRVY